MQAAAGQPDPTPAGEDADGDAVTSSLKIGDIISLFALEAFGFLRADGFVTNDLTVNPLDVKVSPAASPDISDCRAGSIVTAHPGLRLRLSFGDYQALNTLHVSFQDPVPQNFEASLFQIESKLSYFAQQLLQDFVSVNNLQSGFFIFVKRGRVRCRDTITHI